MAGRIRRYLTGFFEDDGGQPGLIERGDMPYLVKRDGTEIALEDLGSGGGGMPFPLAAGDGVPGFDFDDSAYALGTLYYEQTFGALYLQTTHPYDVSAAVTAGGTDPATLPNLGITYWVRVAGDDNGWPVPGVTVGSNGNAFMQGKPGKGGELSDLLAFTGSGNGLYWNYNNSVVDGQQELWVQVGVNGAKAWGISDAAGTLGAPPGGIKFPTADPHVVGAWWDNAGTLTKSAG